MSLFSENFPFHRQEELDVLSGRNSGQKPKVGNLGDQYFYPAKYLQENLNYVLVFSENTKKRVIPNGSVWEYTDTIYRPEILRDNVGCGMTMYLTEKGILKKDLIQTVSEYSYGRGNHFLNKGPFDEDLDYLLLHADMNPDKIIPKTLTDAEKLVKTATNKRQELLENISDDLGVSAHYLSDWPHNHFEFKEDTVTYLKGVVDTKKTEGLGLLALNPQDGCALYGQREDILNGYMQHGLGVKNHNFLKEFKLIPQETQSVYSPTKDSKVAESFKNFSIFLSKFYSGTAFIQRILPSDITIRCC